MKENILHLFQFKPPSSRLVLNENGHSDSTCKMYNYVKFRPLKNSNMTQIISLNNTPLVRNVSTVGIYNLYPQKKKIERYPQKKKDIFIFGTCRLCHPIHNNIIFVKELRKNHSRQYITNNGINIYTEPVNYTTKLIDVLDSIYYMKGKLYNNLNPKTNKMLQSIFFRGHPRECDLISPNTHPNMSNSIIEYGKIIIEIFSIKQYIINTKKYGDEFYLQNLPWKITRPDFEHNGITFDEKDFIIKHMNREECFVILHKIKQEVNCDILIIGPYISKKVPDFVNDERIETQKILKEFCFLYGCDYFDLSETIKHHDIEVDETHFNEYGKKVLSIEMYNFIIK